MPIRIRPAHFGDIARLYRIELTSIRSLWASHYSEPQIEAWCRILSPAYHARCLSTGRKILVAVEENEVLGFGQLDVSGARLMALYTAPEQTGRGVGRQLLSAIEDLAQETELRELRLAASLNAASFYARAGYLDGAPVVFQLEEGLSLRAIEMYKSLR